MIRGSEAELAKAVGTIGPVSVSIDDKHPGFLRYRSGVWSQPDCRQHQLSHAVLAVGYGTTSEGQDYWIIKNSWGPGWGDHGYIKMAKTGNNMCGIATRASYAIA